MTAAWLLTILALVGIAIGAAIGDSRRLSARVGAAGGGLLFGIFLFWLLPEISETAGWAGALGLAAAACGLLVVVDRCLIHQGLALGHGAITPLLIAIGIHSFLDGWSVRVMGARLVTSAAVLIGLALHKIPEGLALGWITRRSLKSAMKASLVCLVVELLTLVGAAVEPRADRSGFDAFGAWWTAVVLAVVAGSFLFLSFHTLVPERKKAGVVPTFLATLFVVGLIAWVKLPGV